MRILSCIPAALLAAGCATPGAPTAPTEPRLVMGAYAVSPPERPWRPAAGAVGATFVHEDSSARHTMAIRILPVVPPDEVRDPQRFAEAARRYNADRLDPERQKILAENYTPVTVNGLPCIAYHVEGSDTAVGDGVSVPFAIVGQLCRHPWHPDWIDVSFSERGGAGGGIAPPVRAAGSKVLASVRAVTK